LEDLFTPVGFCRRGLRRRFEEKEDQECGCSTDWEVDIEAVNVSFSEPWLLRQVHLPPPPGHSIREDTTKNWSQNTGQSVDGADPADESGSSLGLRRKGYDG
tara:strand:- start:3308 stop:3613 length:306 start_codon:yes stop_codon:yes gene_type:complete